MLRPFAAGVGRADFAARAETYVRLVGAAVALVAAAPPASAAPTDIVPFESVDYDAYNALVADGVIPGQQVSPQRLLTRGEIAAALAARQPVIAMSGRDREYRALLQRDFLLDTDDAAKAFPLAGGSAATARAGIVIRSGSPSGEDIRYRANVSAGIARDVTGVVTLSNEGSDLRSLSYSDYPHAGRSTLTNAYVTWQRSNGFQLVIGRKPERWGPGYRGTTMLSDNSSSLDQIQLQFPFSLGKHLGQHYTFTELAATYAEGGLAPNTTKQRYFAARRIEYQFNPRFTVEFGEAFKSTAVSSLLALPFPLNQQSVDLTKVFPGTHIGNIDDSVNYVANLGMTYGLPTGSRVYAQFLIDDLKSPFGSPNKVVPRKVAYLVGGTLAVDANTRITAEYVHVDPTTYTYHNENAVWTQGLYQYMGLATGPNSREWYGRLQRQAGLHWDIVAEARTRRRISTFPAPEGDAFSANVDYHADAKTTIAFSVQDYRQRAEGPAVAVDPAAQEGYAGSALRQHQVMMTLRKQF